METHIGPARGHEYGEVCQMVTGAGGVALVDMRPLAALQGPVTIHFVSRIVPECTFCLIIFWVYWLNKKMKTHLDSREYPRDSAKTF